MSQPLRKTDLIDYSDIGIEDLSRLTDEERYWVRDEFPGIQGFENQTPSYPWKGSFGPDLLTFVEFNRYIRPDEHKLYWKIVNKLKSLYEWERNDFVPSLQS